MSQKKIDKIKNDLRALRKINHSIEVSMRFKEWHERSIEHLLSRPQSEGRDAQIARVQSIIDGFDIDGKIAEATEIEERYMRAINELDAVERAIIIDGYINGKPYWKIGKEIGYSERSISRRIDDALKKISEMT